MEKNYEQRNLMEVKSESDTYFKCIYLFAKKSSGLIFTVEFSHGTYSRSLFHMAVFIVLLSHNTTLFIPKTMTYGETYYS